MKLFETEGVLYEAQHAVLALLYMFLGGALAYLTALPQTSILDALTHWQSARTILLGAAAMGIFVTLAQAQKSFVKPAASLFIAVVFASAMTACNQPVYPILSQLEKDVAADLAAGKTAPEIASDVCHDLGGSALTDAACSGATQIAIDTITFLLDTKVLSATATTHALEMRPALAAMKP